MGHVWAIVIAGGILAMLTAGLFTWTAGRARGAIAGVVIGAAGGMVGAFLILRPEYDVVPDAAEGAAVAILILLGSLGLIIITWLRWPRG